MGVVAKRLGEPIARGDFFRDWDGKEWCFDCVTRSGDLICTPAAGGPPKILPPHKFPDVVVDRD